MNRKDKIKLLRQVATGNNEALYQINKGMNVIFLTMIDDESYWVSYFNLDDPSKDVDIDNLTTDQILNDPSIHKYTSTELRKIQKRRFVFAMPPELLNRSQPEIMEFYNKYFAEKKRVSIFFVNCTFIKTMKNEKIYFVAFVIFCNW